AHNILNVGMLKQANPSDSSCACAETFGRVLQRDSSQGKHWHSSGSRSGTIACCAQLLDPDPKLSPFAKNRTEDHEICRVSFGGSNLVDCVTRCHDTCTGDAGLCKDCPGFAGR